VIFAAGPPQLTFNKIKMGKAANVNGYCLTHFTFVLTMLSYVLR
jgi:riboflavin synthase alpha subunit